MVDILIGLAQDKGLDEIYGSVLSENSKMLTVAEKLGFKITGNLTAYPRVAGIEMMRGREA